MNIIKRDDIRGLYPEELNGNTAEQIGFATCKLLQKETPAPRIAIGYDCRHGNIEIQNGFARGFQSAGGTCDTFGLLSTEHVYYICGTHPEYTAGAMITASHNPKEYNGIKMLHGGCVPFTSAELAEIGSTMQNYTPSKAQPTAPQLQLINFNEYADTLLKISGLDKREDSNHGQIRVVVLAGHGMGAVAFGSIAAKLQPKGLQVALIEPEPDGDFPNGVPNPLNKEYMAKLASLVEQHQADLGICFDGDADRAGFVDAWGQEIIPSQVLALIAKHRLAQSKAEAPVIMRNLCCSQLIADQFPKDGAVQLIDTPVGHGRIKLLMRHPQFQSRCVFAGEHSGHYFYPDFFYVDSGVLTSLNMIRITWELREQKKSLPEMLASWRKNYVWSGEINFQLNTQEEVLPVMRTVWNDENKPGIRRFEVAEDPQLKVQRVFENNGQYTPEKLPAPDLKMQYSDNDGGWWFVLRPSGNEPRLRLNVEAWGNNAATVCKDKTAQLIQKLLSLGAKQ